MEIGTPLHECLGDQITVASTGSPVCGNVLGASGFDVSHEAGLSKPTSHMSDIKQLLTDSKLTTPYKPR